MSTALGGSPFVRPSALRTPFPSGGAHRTNVAAADVAGLPNGGTAPTATGQTGGSLVSATTYNFAIAAVNRYGATTPTAIGSASPGGTNTALRLACTQATNISSANAEDGYEVFLSTDAQPLWVGHISEAQRASGIIISGVGTLTAGGAANSVDVRVVGTGIPTSSGIFQANNAVILNNTGGGVGVAGYSLAHLLVRVVVNDLRSLPQVVLVPMLLGAISGVYFPSAPLTLTPMASAGSFLYADAWVPVDGASSLIVAIQSITGNISGVTVWVEMA